MSTGTGTITITAGECAENFAGMKKIGQKASIGFSLADLQRVQSMFPDKSEFYDLSTMLPPTYQKVENAYLLIVRSPFNYIADSLYQILLSPESVDQQQNISGVAWDTNKYMYGRVVNSIARYNLCFADLQEFYKIGPDYQNKMGTVYNTKKIPPLQSYVDFLNSILPGPFYLEGNYYYDINTCYISMHRDKERMRTIGYRIGATFPLIFRWYYNTDKVSDLFTLQLNHGDLYIMTGVSSGCIKDKSGLYLKHAAGYCNTTIAK